MTLPETVKVARAHGFMDTAVTGYPFPMTLGNNEVALLLSMHYWFEGTLAAGTNTASIGLWRKTDTNPVAIVTDHTDMIWSIVESVEFVAESAIASGKDYITFPRPFVLIRPPRLIIQRAFFVGQVEMRLFYVIKKVSDKELSELMTKDHE